MCDEREAGKEGERMTDVEILREARAAAMEEQAIARQMERLAEVGGPRGLTGQALKQAGDRKTNDAQAARLQQFEGLIQRLAEKREENMQIMQQAEDVIEQLKDRSDRVIIRYYYVEGESDYWIAREMEKSQQWVNERRLKIIEILTQKKKKRGNGQSMLK